MTPVTKPGQSATWIPARSRLAEPRNARAQARKVLSAWGLAEHSDVVEVIVSELVTNAIRHGKGEARTRISWDARCLRVEVHDDGPGRPQRRRAAASDECGRGLILIDGLLESYGGSLGVTDDARGAGKTVYILVCLAGQAVKRPRSAAELPVTAHDEHCVRRSDHGGQDDAFPAAGL